MGVAGYFPGGLRDLRRELKDAVAEAGRREEAEAPAPEVERYELVEEYDPVLRAHCRLDRLG